MTNVNGFMLISWKPLKSFSAKPFALKSSVKIKLMKAWGKFVNLMFSARCVIFALYLWEYFLKRVFLLQYPWNVPGDNKHIFGEQIHLGWVYFFEVEFTSLLEILSWKEILTLWWQLVSESLWNISVLTNRNVCNVNMKQCTILQMTPWFRCWERWKEFGEAWCNVASHTCVTTAIRKYFCGWVFSAQIQLIPQ